MKVMYTLLLIIIFSPLLLMSCGSDTTEPTKNITYVDVVSGFKVRADLSSMKYHYGGLTNDLSFCGLEDKFKCIMRDERLWVGIPRDLSFDTSQTWKIGNFKFSSEPISRLFECAERKDDIWVKVKDFTSEEGFIYILNDHGEIKLIGYELPQNAFKKEEIGNISEYDVLGYESLFIAVDSCGIRMP